ncbi:hypothetical protein CWO85_03370 [Candidatus Phytoplasma ziziphi]|uniref:Uncharacterized protein n=3 Tax=Ziziphus jujuba witches'-broom phytoplasma TaxID=135727 RepID=A0A660HM88_ZIZJU|nr:hypothetical protein [Candidatus Phytoplasma ziziphi]AYJ01161.1 hypothetical protein CWO85_01260 [Candidatus Phytoplasma ziziphi]AYJ01475.1 hypothetical protein CWO85_03155 [Candidatus Phytoplasma ziziphi]AYJ01516.1 hypothetical protein CWO85_03370 [Candidatus Phytoplasma ziziphi]
MNKYLYGLKEIINFLIQQNYFKIRLFNQKTNYNVNNQTLYLNYADLYEILVILKKIKSPPFKIQMNLQMTKKYTFDLQKKILYLKQEPEINTMVALNEKLYQQVFGEAPQEDGWDDLIERNRKKLFGEIMISDDKNTK